MPGLVQINVNVIIIIIDMINFISPLINSFDIGMEINVTIDTVAIIFICSEIAP